MKKTKNEIQVPVRGNLGLLAYGHKGLIAWRKAIKESKKENKTEKVNEKEK